VSEARGQDRVSFGEAALGGGLITVFALPPLMLLTAAVGWALGAVAGVLLGAPFLAEPRLAHTFLGQVSGEWVWLAAWSSMAVAALITWAHWFSRSPMQVEVEGAELSYRGALWRRRIHARDVVRAFVTSHPGEPGTLQLWTRWGDAVIPARRVVGATRPEAFGELTEAVAAALAREGKHLELGVPPSEVTNADRLWLWWLFWPHRRVLVRRAERLDGPAGASDHRQALPSLALAWLLRPAPWALLVTTLAALGWVAWGTTAEDAPVLLIGVGLLSSLALPAWNALKGHAHHLWNGKGLTPEALVGHVALAEVPTRLVPAPGCLIHLGERRLSRPDGMAIAFDDIARVEYGPVSGASAGRDALQGAIASTVWHLAVTRTAQELRRPIEVYGNASLDIVRYGDLDAGYALFNWTTAREVAMAAGAELVLATGRVGQHRLGEVLAARLERDLTRYDPEAIVSAMAQRGERCRVHVRANADTFEAWGPLTRQPELCATPPIFKAVGLVVCILLMTLGYSPAGLLAGYLLSRIVADVVTAMHFARTGFAMDRTGVWVRGVCIRWQELEASTLMPIVAGPVLFCGPGRMMVVGHLGGSYHERAWLGCAAYDWIRRNVQLEALDDPVQEAQ